MGLSLRLKAASLLHRLRRGVRSLQHQDGRVVGDDDGHCIALFAEAHVETRARTMLYQLVPDLVVYAVVAGGMVTTWSAYIWQRAGTWKFNESVTDARGGGGAESTCMGVESASGAPWAAAGALG